MTIDGIKFVWKEDEINRDEMHLITVYKPERDMVTA